MPQHYDNPWLDPMWDQQDGTEKLEISDQQIQRPGKTRPPGAINFFTLGMPEYRTQRPPPSLMATFASGMGQSILHPVATFLPDDKEEAERPDGWTMGHTVSELAGEIAGIGISFLPFLKGTQLALKGVGFASRTPTFRVLEGIISGGAYEAFSDTTEDPLTRIALGAGVGAAAEVALMGAARAWRGRFRTGEIAPERTGPETRPERLLGPSSGVHYDVHPTALSMERNLHPSGGSSLEEATERLRIIADNVDQVEMAAARIANVQRPFGEVILVGITEPGKSLRALRRQFGDNVELVVTAEEAEGAFEILLRDRRPRTRLEQTGMSEDQITKFFFSDEGTPPDYEELLAFLREPGGKEGEVVIEEATLRPGLYGRAQPGIAGDPSQIEIRASEPAVEKVATLVHEYVHHFQFMLQRRKFIDPAGEIDAVPDIWELILREGEDLTSLASDLNPGQIRTKNQGLTHVISTVEREAERLTEEALSAQLMSKFDLDYADALKAAKKRMADNPLYYYDPEEQLSRAFEIMFLDPRRAKNVAPRLTTRLAALAKEEGPKMEFILTRTEHKKIHKILEGLWTKQDDGFVRLYNRVDVEFGPKQAKQFQETGFYEGMETTFGGEPWYVSKVPGKDGVMEIRNPKTGLSKSVRKQDVHRPLMGNVIARNEGIITQIKEMLKKPAQWVGVVLREAPVLDEAAAAMGQTKHRWAVRKGIIDLSRYDRSPSMKAWLDENKEIHQQVLRELEDTGKDMSPEDVMRAVLKRKGQEGVVFDDMGRYLIFRADERSMAMAEETMSHRWVKATDGEMDSPWIEPTQDNLMESILREAGVTDREMEFFKSFNPFDDVAEQEAERLGLMDRIMQGAARVNAQAGDEHIETVAGRAGLRIDKTTDGDVRILSQDNQQVARMSSEADARAYLNEVGPDHMAVDLEAGASVKSSAMPRASGGSVRMPKPFEQVQPDQSFFARFLDSSQLFLTGLTAMENIAKSAERRGFGPIYTRIFTPVQEALVRVDNQMAGIKRDLLGGKTFKEQVDHISDLQEMVGKGLPKAERKARREQMVTAIESMSKEEIARPGGLLKRGMTEEEIALADTISSLELGDDIPRLTGLFRMAGLAIKSKSDFVRMYNQMKRVELSPEYRKVLEDLFVVADDAPDSLAGVWDELGLSEKERLVLGIIDDTMSKGVENRSLFAISRYAAAKPLGKGFKSARDEYMHRHGFTGIERKFVDELEKTYKAAFEVSNLDSKREIGGYWPHMRKWIEQGFKADDEFFRKQIPDSIEWSAARIRTGELDVYLKDPYITTYKYIRSMLMKQEFDPILPGVKESLGDVEELSPRMHRIFTEYLHEATGRPHQSFQRLHEMISESSHIMFGKRPDERFTRDVVNGFGAFANAAAIPFRPLLIARNYFQMVQMIAPRTGMDSFYDGLQMAMSEEGFKEAVQKNIVTRNVIPTHAADDILGQDVGRWNRRMQRVFQKGFEWYQRPDDLGRAAAFFAQKARINKHIDDFMKGRIDYATFKQRSKVNTFDSLDIQEFDNLWGAGRYEEASDWLGSRLARETIFRYGHANHPAGWGSVLGRLYGTFGTWPTQYKDFLLQGLTRGSTADRLEFLAVHSAINAGTLAAGAAVGVDLMSWVSYPSLNYTGGPGMDFTINAIQAFGGSPTEQALAKRNLIMMFPSLNDPRSIFVPGSYAIGDLFDAMQAADPTEALQEGLGVRMLHKGSRNPMRDVFD